MFVTHTLRPLFPFHRVGSPRYTPNPLSMSRLHFCRLVFAAGKKKMSTSAATEVGTGSSFGWQSCLSVTEEEQRTAQVDITQ